MNNKTVILKEKYKKRIARVVGIGGIAGIYFFMIYITFSSFLSYLTISLNDRGIILEIFGFILFLSPIRLRIASGLSSVYENWKKETISLVIEIISILTIISGLLLQFTKPIIPF